MRNPKGDLGSPEKIAKLQEARRKAIEVDKLSVDYHYKKVLKYSELIECLDRLRHEQKYRKITYVSLKRNHKISEHSLRKIKNFKHGDRLSMGVIRKYARALGYEIQLTLIKKIDIDEYKRNITEEIKEAYERNFEERYQKRREQERLEEQHISGRDEEVRDAIDNYGEVRD